MPQRAASAACHAAATLPSTRMQVQPTRLINARSAGLYAISTHFSEQSMPGDLHLRCLA